MKLLIIGSRSIKILDKRIDARLCELLEEGVELIISGGARGVDTLAEKFARAHGVPMRVVLPDYGKHPGKVAPLVRDREMVDMADHVLAIWDGSSTGTVYTVKYAREQGKSAEVYDLSKNQMVKINM